MNVFEAGVTIHLVDKVSAALGQIAQQFTKTQTAATALQARLNTIKSTFSGGLIMAAGGAALAAPLVIATKAAMDLQTALGRVQIATGASNAEMQQLNETLTKTANATGIFSKPTLATFAADMYASGIRNVSQINELLPLFAKGADLMKIISHGKISPEEAAHTFVAMAHQFGRYDAASMKPIVEAAVATAPSLPGGLAALRGMGGYVNVLGNRILGMNPIDLLALESAINQTSGSTGAGGRGGLSGAMLIAALKRTMPGVFGAGLLSGKSAFSAEVMGLAKGGVSTIFTDGKMDLGKLVDVLTRFESQSSGQIAKEMLAHVSMLGKKAPEEKQFLENFLKTPGAPKAQLLTQLLANQAGSASTVLQLFGDPTFISNLRQIQDRIKAFKGIEAMQAQAMKMLEPQLLRLQTNFTTLASTVGMHMIPILTVVVTKLGDFLDRLNAFAEKHPVIVQTVVSLAAAASGMLILGGTLRMLQAGFMGLQLIAGPLSAGIVSLVPMLTPLVALLGPGLATAVSLALRFIGPLGIAITAVALTVANWDKIMGFVHEHQRFFIAIATAAAKAAEALGNALSGLLKWLGAVISSIGSFIGNLTGLSGVVNGIQKAMGGIGATVKQNLDNAMRVDDVTAKRNENYLRSHGLGNVVDSLKGSTPSSSARSAPLVVNDHSVNNFHVQQVPGHDHEACLKTLKKAASNLGHSASAVNGNSVGRSINHGGATRP